MRFVLTDYERHLVALRRAVIEYGRERYRFDSGREVVRDEMVSIELDNDGSGTLLVGSVGRRKKSILLTWHALDACHCKTCAGKTAADLVNEARSALELRRFERDRPGIKRFGDPRRGRKRATPSPSVSNG